MSLVGSVEKGGTLTTPRPLHPRRRRLGGFALGTARSYYLFDGLGSVAAVTNGSGAVVNGYTYGPYGATTETTLSGAVSNPWRYTGGVSGYHHRLLQDRPAPLSTRPRPLISTRPSGQEANSYLHVGGDPANSADPTGCGPCEELFEALPFCAG